LIGFFLDPQDLGGPKINPTFLIGFFLDPQDLGGPKINPTFLIGQINPTNLVGLPKNAGIWLEGIFRPQFRDWSGSRLTKRHSRLEIV